MPAGGSRAHKDTFPNSVRGGGGGDRTAPAEASASLPVEAAEVAAVGSNRQVGGIGNIRRDSGMGQGRVSPPRRRSCLP